MSQGERHVVIGTGPLGMAVMQELLAKAKRVRMVNRSGQVKVPAEVEVVKGDVTDPVVARKVCDGATVVYQCAKPPYTDWPDKFPPILEGTIAGAASVGAKLVFADNLYMYSPFTGPLTEDLDDVRKIKRLQIWCNDVNAAHNERKHVLLYVEQEI